MVQSLDMNLAQDFWQRLTREPSRVLLERLEPSGAVTWRQTRGAFVEEASRWMAALRSAGIGPGDRVALSLGKADGLVAAHVAILGIGAGVVPLNSSLTPREIAAVLAQAEVGLAITPADMLARAPALRAAVRGPWWVTGQTMQLPPETTPLEAVMATVRSGPEPIDQDDDELALLLFTSGTTGAPKGVGLTHGNLRANLRALLVETWRMHEDDRLLHALPPHHLHGLGLGLYGTLLVGNAAVLLERFEARVVIRALDSQRISVFMGVPTMYHRMVEAEEACTFTTMRLFTCGSAPLSPETFRRFQDRFGFPIIERYGLTETGINTANPLHGPHRPGSVGLPLPGVHVGVFAPQTGQRLAPGEVGEICVRGPNVFHGYWRNPEATAAAFRDGWFRTGDLGTMSADGYVTILGRIKELIIVGGTNVTPGEVEAVLEAESGVAECAVVGVPDIDLGERIAAFVVPRAGEDPQDLERRLRLRAEQQLAPYKRPRHYSFLSALPRNSMGKVERGKLRVHG
jgi:malonyl-CoA/methylmalonyl-CoA synthetase